MNDHHKLSASSIEKVLMEVLIRFGLIVLLIYLCAHVFAPFAGILLWGLIMAVALYPIHQGIAKRLGGRQGRASIYMIVAVLLVLGVPMLLLGNSFGEDLQKLYMFLDAGTLELKPPRESVAEWPLIGQHLYSTWNQASTDFADFVRDNQLRVQAVSAHLLKTALNALKAMMMLLGAFIVAGIMMAYSQAGIAAMTRVFKRFAGEAGGLKLQALCTSTVRSVAVGVLGVACVQAILFGLGFMLMGLKIAGVLALITLFIGIIQLPAFIVALPVIVYMWIAGESSTIMNVVFTIYFIGAGLVDNILKPILLGRGVDAPMPIILIGALGGMVSAGFIGLFIGAVVLAVGYKIAIQWVEDHPQQHRVTDVASNA